MQKVLIQLDSDAHSSAFDAIVAVDCGIDHLLSYREIETLDVRDIVHGAIFTRSPAELCNTAIFVGGSDPRLGEDILRAVTDSFFGPLRVSVMMDCSGANTTAAAAVLSAASQMDWGGANVAVLAATGAVGSRIARLLASLGARIRVGSRSEARGETICQQIRQLYPAVNIEARVTNTSRDVHQAIQGCQAIIGAGAAGISLVNQADWQGGTDLKIAIDLNAVPPAGIEGISPADRGELRNNVWCFGAMGVGGLKMRIHRRAVMALFESNDRVLDVDQIFELGRSLLDGS